MKMKTEEETRKRVEHIYEDDKNIKSAGMPGEITADYLRQNRIHKNALEWVLEDEIT